MEGLAQEWLEALGVLQRLQQVHCRPEADAVVEPAERRLWGRGGEVMRQCRRVVSISRMPQAAAARQQRRSCARRATATAGCNAS